MRVRTMSGEWREPHLHDDPGECFGPAGSVSTDPASRTPGRVRRAFVANKRNELLTPIHAIIDISERVLSELGGVQEGSRGQFAADMILIRDSGQRLLVLVNEILDPDRLAASPPAELAAVQSRIRHDMLNALNPVTSYSDMWLADAAEHFLDDFVPDLKLIREAGRRCCTLADRILSAGDMERVEGSDSELRVINNIVAVSESEDDAGHAPITGRLLVVDDNETNREILRRRLELQGHQVEEACDGLQALAMLHERSYDLVLLDIIMPQLNGLDVLVRMKGSDALRPIPVIMISALDETDVVVRCIKLGAEDYLSKPFNPVFLKARIGACLEKRLLAEQFRREKQRADELLHVILPHEIVRELKATNAVIPRRHDNVAVLFADIVNFTPYCERNPPEVVVHQLQELVCAWEESALRHNVEKIKTIGDAFMAASGLLNEAPEPVLNCVRCGLELIETTGAQHPDWNLRVGIHCGQVVAGILGHRQYLFDLWGDTVNTAARMESHGTPGTITLSAQAWQQIEPGCLGTSMGCVPVKGKGELQIVRFDGFRE
ncbi:MAG TPA: adenylate/guanylate cyclase domain-containing protein [Planctomycetaceae bacterium]|nr:adenylate/guanylate cyclase domain-containing protein [Planctomycetaceae bacterium]